MRAGDGRRRVGAVVFAAFAWLVVAPIAAQQQGGEGTTIAGDADVQGAIRLFSAWMDGQLLNRHLPGVAVGVVSDQTLVWSKGFGFADVEHRVAMTPQTKF